MNSKKTDTSNNVFSEKDETVLSEVTPEDPVSSEEMPAGAERHMTYPGANILKSFLMPFVCIASFSFPGPYGSYISELSSFAPNAFFILCGFLVAASEKNDPGIYKRVLKRSAWQFALLFGIVIIINELTWLFNGVASGTFQLLTEKEALFDILVLCNWPLLYSSTIWFIQALFYARVILYLMNRSGLMKHYKTVLIITFLLNLLLGEFAGVLHLSFHGHTYIPGNAITRALPYMLLGRFLYEKKDAFFSRPSWNYCLAFIAGILAAIAEIVILTKRDLLVYTGHMIGYGIMAFSVCCLFLKIKNVKMNDVKIKFLVMHGRSCSWRIYLLTQPVFFFLQVAGSYLFRHAFYPMMEFSAILVYLICLAITLETGLLSHLISEDSEI